MLRSCPKHRSCTSSWQQSSVVTRTVRSWSHCAATCTSRCACMRYLASWLQPALGYVCIGQKCTVPTTMPSTLFTQQPALHLACENCRAPRCHPQAPGTALTFLHGVCVHVQLWGGNSSQRKELQSYLIRELDINFEVSRHICTPPPTLPTGLVCGQDCGCGHMIATIGLVKHRTAAVDGSLMHPCVAAVSVCARR